MAKTERKSHLRKIKVTKGKPGATSTSIKVVRVKAAKVKKPTKKR